MKTFDLDRLAFSIDDKHFHALGRTAPDELPEEKKERFRFKLRNKKSIDLGTEGMWATLGWADGSEGKLKGKLQFSGEGQTNSLGPTLDLIKDIYSINPLLNGKELVVTERFINFEEVKFRWDKDRFELNEIPELRLTLFLKPDEGALVCYQHSDKSKHNDPDAEFEFIQPQRTDNSYSSNRDRLNYIFPLLPETELEDEDKNGKTLFRRKSRKRSTDFILKIFTYKRNAESAEKLYEEALITLNKKASDSNLAYELIGKNKYGVLNYDPIAKDFLTQEEHPIDFNKKTLLLLHGTFVNVWKTYDPLFNEKFGNPPLLNRLLADGKFEQIIALNYATISHDAEQNAKVFYELLGEGNRFTQAVSIVGSSRGCLLAKFLSADPNNEAFTADKVIMFSGANGVGFFTTGKHIARFLSIMRRISGPGGKVALALLQFSAEYFLSLPGAQQMTPKSATLKRVLEMNPHPDTEYFNVVSDWNTSLTERWQQKIFGGGLDLLLKGILGREHDWVVGCPEQELYFTENGNTLSPRRIVSMHARYFDIHYTKDHNTHEIIWEYFPDMNSSDRPVV